MPEQVRPEDIIFWGLRVRMCMASGICEGKQVSCLLLVNPPSSIFWWGGRGQPWPEPEHHTGVTASHSQLQQWY